MSVLGSIKRSIIRFCYPAIAAYYRSQPACPVSILKLLGIADIAYRSDFYTLSHAVDKITPSRGFIAECGVYRGATLLGMAHKLRRSGAASFHLLGFDSFEGFPEPVQEDAIPDGTFHERTAKGVFSDTSYEDLKGKVEALGFENQITLVKGYFENTLHHWSDKEFVLVHLDCDLYQSYLTCLEFFYPRVKSGGYIVFDEYGEGAAPVYPGAQKAIDLFLSDKPEKIQRLPESNNPRYFIIKK